MSTRSVLLLTLLVLCASANALIGYDCGGQGLNVTTISAIDVANCDTANVVPIEEQIPIQLLQISDYAYTDVIQCLVEIDRTITYCGMNSHISFVQNGRRVYLHTTSLKTCREMQTTGLLYLGGSTQITGLKPNTTDWRSLTLAGTYGNDGKCQGVQYSDPFGTWDNVAVQASVKITLANYHAPIKMSGFQVVLASGKHCPMDEGYCLDTDNGDSYWSPIPIDSCQFTKYDVLYDGLANKVTTQESNTPIMYSVTSRDTTFALTKTTETNLCGYTLANTEHPKLLVLEIKKGMTFKQRNKVPVDNLDIFSYVNSKFIYVEKHLKRQLTTLYQDVMAQKCALEKQILKNALSLANTAPTEMAYAIMKAPGYTAITAGEAIHIVKCIPVTCKIRHTENCYHELPVTHQNSSYFLAPRSRILQRTGTIRDCNELLPVMYQIHDTWYKLLPKPVEALAPHTIQPLTKPTWKYISPSTLATNGIYTERDIDRLREHIMFPLEKPAMINTIAQGAMGRHIPPGTVTLGKLLDEDALNTIAEHTGARIWHGFLTFGSASAGIIGIFMILRIIKFTIDTIIHGYALHSVYGWSIHLLGAVWSSITHLLIHLAHPTPTSTASDEEAAVEMTATTSPEDKATPHYPDLRAYLHENAGH